MDYKNEEVIYLLKFMDDYIENLIYNVLEDSIEDPHYSAITASNLIKCYVKVMNEIGCNLNCCNVKEYFENKGFTAEEYMIFLKKSEKESSYYIGRIF